VTMVDVSRKAEIFREATAKGKIRLKSETLKLIREEKIAKGDPLYTAKIAGVFAAKKTAELVPLCHPLPLNSVEVEAKILDKTTVWDMVKQYEKDAAGQYPNTEIENVYVVRKLKQV